MTAQHDDRHAPGRFFWLVSWYSVADAIATVMNLVGLLVAIRILSVEEFGIADLCRTAQWFVGSLVGLNVFDSASRFYFDTDNPHERRRMLGGGLTASVLAGGVAGLLLAACAPLSLGWISGRLSPTIWWLIALGIPANNLVMVVTQTTVIRAAPRLYAGIVITQALLVVAGIGLWVVWLRLGVEGYFLALVVAAGGAGLVGFLAQARQYAWNWLVRPVKRYVSFGAPSTVTELMHYGFGLGARVLLARWASPLALGWYGFAERVQVPVQLMVAAVGKTWVPWLLAERPVAHQPVSGTVRQLSGYVLMVLGIVVIYLRELIGVVGGARYHEAYAAALILLLAKWLLFVGDYILSASLTVAKQTYHRIWVFALAYTAAGAMGWWTIGRWGATGVALAMAVASAGVLIGMWVISRRVYPLQHGVRALLLASGLALGLAVWGSWGATPMMKPLVVLVYLGLLWWLGCVPLPRRLSVWLTGRSPSAPRRGPRPWPGALARDVAPDASGGRPERGEAESRDDEVEPRACPGGSTVT